MHPALLAHHDGRTAVPLGRLHARGPVPVQIGGSALDRGRIEVKLTIANNTVLGCPGAGINVSSGGRGATRRGNFRSIVTNNILYSNGQGIVETSDGERAVGPGNRYLNNLVYRSSSGNRLEPEDSAASPAIDGGTNTAAAQTDLDAAHRPQGRRIDIGAFEWRPAQGRDR